MRASKPPTAATVFTDLIDLAAERLGGAVISANDEFFAPKEALLKAGAPEWREGVYTERGKWMDGWETRRRREAGHDWCLVRLGLPGVVRGIVVDTSFFRGNYPEACSVEGTTTQGTPGPEALLDASWTEILPRSSLKGDTRNEFAVAAADRLTHLRLNIFPDGGVARLRVFGEVVPKSSRISGVHGEVDLAAMENGAFVVSCSDMFFGHRQNLILPGRSTHMGDGWETKRRRGAGHDWSIIRLAASGRIHRVELDTDHYKGNAPAAFSLEGSEATGVTQEELTTAIRSWGEIIPLTSLQPHTRHSFECESAARSPISHVRLNIFPDGGIARLRLFGAPSA
ncbi:MAG: allantoicase [Anaerolineae bacterium]|nr:allantoicase [Gemmatimonadaceae bacterium]